MNTMPLTPVDYIFTGAGSQPITFAFHYAQSLNPAILQKSLNETLEHFPLLRSRLQRIPDDTFQFQIGKDGLIFEVTESDTAFKKSTEINQFISPVKSVVGEPLTGIRLTQTPNGSVLAVSISHALVDGYSYFHFLSSWARLCRGERFLPPFPERSILLEKLASRQDSIGAGEVLDSGGLFYGERRPELKAGGVKDERFFISNQTIKSHLEEARRTHKISLTENDIIAALLWKKYIPLWNRDSENGKSYMTLPFDFRRVLSGFPKNYFGCALCFATASSDFGKLAEATVSDLAVLVRNSVGKIKDNFIYQSLGTFDSLRRKHGLAAMEEVHLRHPHRGMIVTNLTRMPIADVDFGLGPPAGYLVYAEVTGSAALLPAQGGIEVLVVHPE